MPVVAFAPEFFNAQGRIFVIGGWSGYDNNHWIIGPSGAELVGDLTAWSQDPVISIQLNNGVHWVYNNGEEYWYKGTN